MTAILLWSVVLMLAPPFWDAKPPADWSDQELIQLLTDSPWAQIASAPAARIASAPGVQVYLATAGPMQAAEQEAERRSRLRRKPNEQPPDNAGAEEYRAWLAENRSENIVLAVRVDVRGGLADQKEVERMERESVMHAGRKKIQMTGHFPPAAGDPYLRMAFPRQIEPGDKKISFDLYVPGVSAPYRIVEFNLKDMTVRGKLEL